MRRTAKVNLHMLHRMKQNSINVYSRPHIGWLNSVNWVSFTHRFIYWMSDMLERIEAEPIPPSAFWKMTVVKQSFKESRSTDWSFCDVPHISITDFIFLHPWSWRLFCESLKVVSSSACHSHTVCSCMAPAVNISQHLSLSFVLFAFFPWAGVLLFPNWLSCFHELEFCCYSLLLVLTESSSFAEKKPTECKSAPAPKKKQAATPAVLKNSSSIKKDVRPDIEQALVRKLESMGVKPVSWDWKSLRQNIENHNKSSKQAFSSPISGIASELCAPVLRTRLVWKPRSSRPSWPGCIQSRNASERETQTTGAPGRRWWALWSRNYRPGWVAGPNRRFQVSGRTTPMVQSLFWWM